MKHLLLFFFLSLFIPTTFPHVAFAQNQPQGGGDTFGTFEVGLPGIPKGQSIDSIAGNGKPILTFISAAVKAVIAILVIVGVISVTIGGYFYMTAGGDGSKVKTAKEIIIAALVGIFLALISVVLLNTINKYLGSGAVEPKLGNSSGQSSSQ